MGNAMRQIVDGMRFQERAPQQGWVGSEHMPITDLMVVSDEEEGQRQYALMVKWELTEEPTATRASQVYGSR